MTGARLNRMLAGLGARQDLILVGLLVLTTVMMILPVPTLVADILIATNITIAILLMMVAIYVAGPVEFSTLPTVILVTTAFRLSLSITTSRMILVQGDAGDIIRTFGEFVIAGNIVVGLVVYLIISIVQFVVITKGSERVAEVAARFTLDALPGKQISIDTDLKNGDIDPAEARRRRRLLERESQLYGAMDGAMKFVKGDAIASLIIVVVNLLGGMAIGTFQRGLSLSDAVQTYSLLAVGDGLIAQIPALLISLTAGIIVTRVTSSPDSNLGLDIVSQITASARVLQVACAVLAGLALVPGFPVAVFLTLSVIVGLGGWVLAARQRKDRERTTVEQKAAGDADMEAARLVLKLGSLADPDGPLLRTAMTTLRETMTARLGIAIPVLRVVEDGGRSGWRLECDGIPAGNGPPSAPGDIAEAVSKALAGVAGQFVGIQEAQTLVSRMEAKYGDLVREALKGAPLPRIAEVLRRLVTEGVPVTNMRAVLEAAAEWGPREANNAILGEHVRIALRRQICHGLSLENGTLSAALLDAAADELLLTKVHAAQTGLQLTPDQATLDWLIPSVRKLSETFQSNGGPLIVLCSFDLRRHLRALLARYETHAAVLSHAEIAPECKVRIASVLRAPKQIGVRPGADPVKLTPVAA